MLKTHKSMGKWYFQLNFYTIINAVADEILHAQNAVKYSEYNEIEGVNRACRAAMGQKLADRENAE